MKIIRIVLLVLIIIGLGLIATQTLWVPPLVNYILSNEKASVTPPINRPLIPVSVGTSTSVTTPVPAPHPTTTPVVVKPPKPVVTTPTPTTTTTAPERCGGNMMNAHQCSTGYHCAPEPGSHLPFGDVGGICVAD